MEKIEYDDFLRIKEGVFESAMVTGPDGVDRQELFVHVMNVDDEGRDALSLMEILKFALSKHPEMVERAANRLYWEKLEIAGLVPKLSDEPVPKIQFDFECIIKEIKPDGRLRLECPEAPEHLREVWAYRVDFSGLCVGQLGRAVYRRLPHRAGYMFIEREELHD